MKFVFFGYDFMAGTLHRLIRDGHELRGLFTFECDNIFNFNRDVMAIAQKTGVPASSAKPTADDIGYFLDDGCDCFVVAGYPYKIPPVDEKRAYAINIHPSFLPKGRGLMPTPYIITAHPEAAGFSIHKLTDRIDEGDILYQEALPLSPRETVETYSTRIAMKVPDVISKIMADLPNAWKNAKPQDHSKASIFPEPGEELRTLDWSKNVEEIDRTARAFGRYGSMARFDNSLWIVYALDAWKEKHAMAPGEIACVLSREVVIAAKDGFVCLKDFQKLEG